MFYNIQYLLLSDFAPGVIAFIAAIISAILCVIILIREEYKKRKLRKVGD